MKYYRMLYAQDRREWVRAADLQLPALRATASLLQHKAREMFDSYQALGSLKHTYTFMPGLVSEQYDEARRALWRVLYYEGMRRANLEEGDV